MDSLRASSRARSKGIHTPLRFIAPILTTYRTFSDLRMPSRRPLVIPATFSSLVPLMKLVSSRRETVILRASTW